MKNWLISLIFVGCLGINTLHSEVVQKRSFDNSFDKHEGSIYLQYVGPVSRSINPVFISSEKLSQSKLMNLFKHCVVDTNDIEQFIITKSDLKKMMNNINVSLPPANKTPKNEHKKFLLGLIENGVLIRHPLSSEQLVVICNIIEKGSIEKYSGLYKAVLNFKHETGVF